ncbi:MAG TPA: SgcJ/EcaC family oxidoreductase [Xanthobacteraceae bacterium]|nr:SgcJ/EcaC family oxidoreductase [Xanthobacteraceae bacterium]
MSIGTSSIAAVAGEAGHEAEVAALAAGFTQAWNRHDMDALANLFAADADFVNVVGMWWRTREEIKAAHAHSHTTFFRDSRLAGEVRRVKFLEPNVATVHVVWELSGQMEPDGSVGEPRQGILLFVAVRRDGRWVVEAAQNTDVLAGALTRPAERS